MRFSKFIIIVTLIFLWAISLAQAASSFPPNIDLDWGQTESRLVDALLKKQNDISQLARQALKTRAEKPAEAMFRAGVFLRAGMPREAIAALRELKQLAPGLDSYQVASIYYSACDKLAQWEVARSVVEIFADNISELDLQNRLLRHLEEKGESFESIDAWMVKMPVGKDNFWLKERLRFHIQHRRGDDLVKALADGIRKSPEDIKGVVAFLDALNYAGRIEEKPWDLAWLEELVRPKQATEAAAIASRLKGLENWATAASFFVKAAAIPLVDAELEEMAANYQAVLSPENLKLSFAVHVRQQLAECLLKMGQNDKAQKWMEEAADLQGDQRIGDPFLAGKVQAASGQRVIEGRIKEKETVSENDPEYWKRRAEYYRGRNQPALEESALKKALALTVPQPESAEAGKKRYSDIRSWVLGDYALFLRRVNRDDEALDLLRKEIRDAPADAASSRRAANLLAFDFPQRLVFSDEVLWSWLARRPFWEFTEERLLWVMLQSAKGDDLERSFARAEEMVSASHPSRVRTLGWIMNRMGVPARSIPLLQDAVERLTDEDARWSAVFALFESYLDVNDWQSAEKLFPDALRRLTSAESSQWYGRIALAAARSGAKGEALRIWQEVASIDPTEMSGLAELARSGLTEELVAFYREMQKSLPDSEIPARALKLLQGK